VANVCRKIPVLPIPAVADGIETGITLIPFKAKMVPPRDNELDIGSRVNDQKNLFKIPPN
jgi:hypothetical protein